MCAIVDTSCAFNLSVHDACQAGILSLFYTQDFKLDVHKSIPKNATATVAAQFNTYKLEAKPKYGVTLSLKARHPTLSLISSSSEVSLRCPLFVCGRALQWPRVSFRVLAKPYARNVPRLAVSMAASCL